MARFGLRRREQRLEGDRQRWPPHQYQAGRIRSVARRGQKDGLLHPPGKEGELVSIRNFVSQVLLGEMKIVKILLPHETIR